MILGWISTAALLLAAGVGSAGWMTPKTRPGKAWTAFLLGGPLFLAPMALLMADFGIFSTARLWTPVSLWAFSGGWRLRRLLHLPFHKSILLGLGLYLALGFLLFGRPHTYLYGGWDPGEYVSTSARVVRTGALRYVEPFWQSMPGILEETFMRNTDLPRPTLHAGYLVLDRETGEMVPDYFHLYPVWLALFTAGGGIPAAYIGQTALALLAPLLMFVCLREIFGALRAVLATAALCANPAMLYFARFPSSELLSMSLVFACLFLLRQRDEHRAPIDLLWVALAAFAAAVCHITNALPLFAMILVTGLRGMRRDRQNDRLDTVALALGAGLGMLRNFWVTPLFIRHLIQRYLVERPDYILGVFAVLLVLTLAGVLAWKIFQRQRFRIRLNSSHLTRIAGLFLILAGVYQYFFRIRFDASPDAINLRSLGWLFSPLGLAIAFAAFLLPPRPNVSRAQWLWFSAGLLSALILIHGKHVQPYYMWAFRRYLPVVIPFFAMLIAHVFATAMERIPQGKRPSLQLPVLAAFLLLLGWQLHASRHLIRTREHRGLPAFVATLASDLQDADFILVDHWQLATPLRHAHGLPAYQLSREMDAVSPHQTQALNELLSRKAAAGESIVYLSHRGPFFHPELHPRFLSRHEHHGQILAWSQSGIPAQVREDHNQATLYELIPGQDPEPETVTIDTSYHAVGLIRGFHEFSRRGESMYRWTNGDAALYIPGLAKGGTATLHLAHQRPQQQDEKIPVRLSLDGEFTAKLQVGFEWATYTIPLPSVERPAQILRIQSDTWNPSEYDTPGYPPDIGIRISAIDIEPVRSPEN